MDFKKYSRSRWTNDIISSFFSTPTPIHVDVFYWLDLAVNFYQIPVYIHNYMFELCITSNVDAFTSKVYKMQKPIHSLHERQSSDQHIFFYVVLFVEILSE